jgi:hypothetical protein
MLVAGWGCELNNQLRLGAVEELRLADHDYVRYVRIEKHEHPEGKAGYQLDRLLGFLADNADKLPSVYLQMAAPALVAVLRGPSDSLEEK